MRSEPSKATRESRIRSLVGSRRRKSARAATLQKASLEWLEARSLLATLPASIIDPTSIIDVSNSGGDESAPSIAVNQNNPLKLASVWTRNDPGLAPGQTQVVEMGTSTDGGKTWTVNRATSGTNGGVGGFISDLTTSNPVVPFPQASDATVAFDRNDNFYILYSQHKADNSAGALLLTKYNFSTGTPNAVFRNRVVYEWLVDPAFHPTLAVDDNLPTFTDVDANGITRTQSDPNSGNVYVAWATQDTPWQDNPLGGNFNPNRIKVLVSSDGGQSFSGAVPVNDSNGGTSNFAAAGGVGSTRTTSPRLVVSQGSAPRAAGTNGPSDLGSPGVQPGQVTVVWDDFGAAATASPPRSIIVSDRLTSGTSANGTALPIQHYTQQFTNSGGSIGDALDGTPNSPVTTDFPITVNVSDPRFVSVSDTVVKLSALHPSIGELQIQLIPPTGSGLPTITLLRNQTDAAGTTNANIGASGVNLGIAPSGQSIGTTFDQYATRNIRDIGPFTGGRGAAAPFVGTFRPEVGSLLGYNGATAGAANSANSINGTWTLRVTDFRYSNNPNPPQFLTGWSVTFTSGMVQNVDANVASTIVHGAFVAPYPTATAAAAQGISPAPVIASDNTLGAYSPFEGRLYVAYVTRQNANLNPADNTDITLAYSDDAGLTWTSVGIVNDDTAATDGFSEARVSPPTVKGRPQFQPTVAVDNANGTVVMSWLDTRNDSARARVATYLTTSIDGGNTFSTNVYANTPQTATDAISGNTVIVGPIPDNQSGGNANRDTVAGFGLRQGLAVYGGQAHPVWSSNINGGGNGQARLDIRTAQVPFAAGPRVVSITQGPIGEPNDQVNTDRASDGTPIASAFQVVFDRFVDPSTFGTNDVKVLYRDTTIANLTGGFVPVSSVVPLDAGPLGATTFQVNFAPRSGVGTYSLVVGPDVNDRIRTRSIGVAPVAGTTQTFASTNVPVTLPANGTGTSTLTVLPSDFSPGQVISSATVRVTLNHPVASSLTVTLIAPDGTQVLLAANEPFPGAGGDQGYQNTVFDDNAPLSISSGFSPFTGSFQPETKLSQLLGRGLSGTWRLQVSVAGTPLSGSIANWSLTLTAGTVTTVLNSGNAMDQNNNGVPDEVGDFLATPSPTSGTSPFVGPFVNDTLPLILPGPHVASTRVPGAPSTTDNLVLNGVVSALDVTFDRDMDPSTVTSAAVLRIVGPTGAITGPFTVLANPQGSDPDPLHPRTYRIGFPTQKLSGSYRITLASTITDSHGNALDTNLNAGIDLLRGATNVPTTPVTYNYGGFPVAVGDGKTAVVTLNIPDDFVLVNPTVQININHLNDPDLQITLVSPTNQTVVLVPYGTGTTGTKANFSNTIFDDSAATLIQNGGPAFFGRFKPSQPLSVLNGSKSGGSWKLIVSDNPSAPNGIGGTITAFSLTFQKTLPSSDLGEPVADQASAGFRIFTMDPTNRQSSTTWTAVGPASMTESTVNNGYAGRVGAVALDPSDPSGNTVYVAGASGGVWKTTNFLTNDPAGPTYIPLTDFGPNSGLNIGGLAVFGRNNDPRQSIVFAGTGEGAATFGYGGNTTGGVGFLRSNDGGSTWQLLDSTDNTLPFAFRDHLFAANGGTATMKVVVDPRPTPNGQVIVYAAMKGANGGLWRSVDTGNTWQKVSNDGAQGTQATDVLLDYNSATIDAVSNPTGNVNIIYAAFAGTGVFVSPNRGSVLNAMVSRGIDPLIVNVQTGQVPVQNSVTPFGANGGRIVLAKPNPLPDNAALAQTKNTLYQGWLYAAVATPGGRLDGVYVTKDYGQNWTRLRLPNLPSPGFPVQARPSNDPSQGDYDLLGNNVFSNGAYDLSLAVDPNNPQVVYLGGTANGNETGLIRIDTTTIFDAHSLLAFDNTRPDGGALMINTSGRAQVVDNVNLPPSQLLKNGFPAGPWFNLIQDPFSPFAVNSTVSVTNTASFLNDGSGVRWTPIDEFLKSNSTDLVPSSNIHQILTLVDPVSGNSRLVVANDQGVFTGVLTANGTLQFGVGNATSPTYSRNGNLQIAQLYYGAAQPSTSLVNSQVASSLFFGNGLNLGQIGSDANVLNNGNIVGSGTTNGSPLGLITQSSGDQAGTGIAVDQQGRNIVYRYYWGSFGGASTDFFQVSAANGAFISRTQGLVQTANDPQWPGYSPVYANGLTFGNFTVNPLNGDQVIISSAAGRIFSTTNQGQNWLSIGEPGALDGTYAPALTYGAPDPSAPAGVGNLNNFIYAGTVGGRIFVTRTGGGAAFNSWTDISGGLDGSPVVKIVTNPTRGSHEAYAITQGGVYHITDSTAAGATWSNITSNLFQLTISPFGNATQAQPALKYLTSIQADWRYVIPNTSTGTGTATGTHPVLYASGDAGVFRSLDNGLTWTAFPNQAFDGAAVDGGYLPSVHVTDLSVSLGKVDPTTGRAVAVPNDPNTLLATTYGRGQFAIRLAPIVFPSQIALDTKLPSPTGSQSGTDSSGRPIVTVAQPVIDGLSEQTAFGNVVRITILDLTDPNNPRIIGGYDPSKPSTDVAANRTDSAGKFQVQVNADGFTSNGIKTLGIQATDGSGTQGNIATLVINLNAKLSSQTAPAVPTITMNPADDTSGGFFITKTTNPRIIGVTDPGVQVQLFNADANGNPSGAALASGTTDGLGNYSLQYPTSPPAVYRVVVVATNQYGSTKSPVFQFQIKTNAPTIKPVLILDPSYDTGFLDNYTAARQPKFKNQVAIDPFSKVTIYRYINGGRGPALNTVQADANGNFSIGLPSALNAGPISLVVGVTDAAGNQGPYSDPLSITVVSVPGDYVGPTATPPVTSRTTPALFRRDPSGTALWFLQGVIPQTGTPFGSSADSIPFQGDFDGDGKADLAVYTPATLTWSINRSSLGSVSYNQGQKGDVPSVGDFDGDGVTDTATYNAATGAWNLAESLAGTVNVTFPAAQFTPQAGDVPVPGDYDGASVTGNKDQVAVYRRSTGTFYILSPDTSTTPAGVKVTTLTVSTGAGDDVPVPGNYDDSATRRQTEAAVYSPSTGKYVILGPNGVARLVTGYQAGDIPAPGDYTATGLTEPAVFRPSLGLFVINKPDGTTATVSYGQAGDIPVASPLIYRNVVQATPTNVGLTPATDTGIKGDFVTSFRNPTVTGVTDPNAVVDLVNTATNQVVGTAQADATGAFSVPVGKLLASSNVNPNGTYTIVARAHGIASSFGKDSAPITLKLVTTDGDYNGDGTTDQAVFRRTANAGINWYAVGAPFPMSAPFGGSSVDVPLSGDFNGDGKTDLAVYRPSTAEWFAQLSPGYAGVKLAQFGWAGVDIPVPADYNGDGKTDVAVYRPTTGEWFVQGSSSSVIIAAPRAGDIPVPGDYENVGQAEFAVFRPSGSQWLILGPNGNSSVFFGGPNDQPVPGAYDATATNKSLEVAVWRPSTGQYFVRNTTTGNRVYQFAVGDIPAPGDYDGNGVTEAAVFRPSTHQWLVAGPNDKTPRVLSTLFGGPQDIPVLSPYKYRALATSAGGGVSAAKVPVVGVGTNAVALNLGSTARNFGNGQTTPTPAPAPAPAPVVVRGRPNQVHQKTPVKIPNLAQRYARLHAAKKGNHPTA